MHFCLPGNLNVSVGVWASLQLAVIMLIFVQARPVAGQDPPPPNGAVAASTGAQFNPSVSQSRLAFDETLIEDAREGHATLRWNELPGAGSYRVSDSTGRVLYDGDFPQAFVSGLENGQHQFSVTAFDTAGQVLATSLEPTVVMVEHWPLAQALALCAVGGLVFVALVGVLVIGASQSSTDTGRRTHPSGGSP